MNLSLFLLICLIVVPAAAHLRQWQPAALFAVVAIVYALFGSIGLLDNQMISGDPLNMRTPFDSYDVAKDGWLAIRIGSFMAFMSGVFWLQTYFDAMRYRRVTKMLFWLFHLGITTVNFAAQIIGFFFPVPKRYTDYDNFTELLYNVTLAAELVAILAFVSLTCLLVWSAVRTWKRRSSGSI